MAKKRKRSHHKRGGRVGAMSLNPKNPLLLIGSVGLGFLAADKVNAEIDKHMPVKSVAATATTAAGTAPVVNSTIVGGGMAGIGALLALKGRKTLPKTVAGGFMIGVGIKRVLQDQGVLSGFQSVPVIGRRMGGYQSIPVVGKIGKIGKVPSILNGYTTSPMPALSGVPNILNGHTTSRMPALSGLGL